MAVLVAKKEQRNGTGETQRLTFADAKRLIGGEEAQVALQRFARIDTSDIDSPERQHMERRGLIEMVTAIEGTARSWGMAEDNGFKYEIWDPTRDSDLNGWFDSKEFPQSPNIPRPNLIMEWNVGAKETVILIPHIDTVPVEDATHPGWRGHNPFGAEWDDETQRFIGRGVNDCKGSGDFSTLVAFKEMLERGQKPKVNVRVIFACDEEVGGHGGLEAMKRKDEVLLARGETRKFLDCNMVLDPDASPNLLAASSGVAPSTITVGNQPLEKLIRMAMTAQSHAAEREKAVSTYLGDTGPEHITGRLSVTKMLWTAAEVNAQENAGVARIVRLKAHTQKINLIPGEFEISVAAGAAQLDAAKQAAAEAAEQAGIKIQIKDDAEGFTIHVFGKAVHAGYPFLADNATHKGINLVVKLLQKSEIFAKHTIGSGSFSCDMRLIPEEPVEPAVKAYEDALAAAAKRFNISYEVNYSAKNPGFFVATDHPDVQWALQQWHLATGQPPVAYGENGGLDTSSLRGIPPAHDPKGQLVALAYGSMSMPRGCAVHEEGENLDPHDLRMVIEVTKALLMNWRDHD